MDARSIDLVAAGGLALAAYLAHRAGVPSDPGRVSREVDIVARTIWGEARGEGYTGMQAVANVIMNRVESPGWWGTDPVSVCMKPFQFSAWNSSDANSGKAARVTTADREFRIALDIAARAVAGTLPDITGGATHYHADYVYPNWAQGLDRTATIGGHIFYV